MCGILGGIPKVGKSLNRDKITALYAFSLSRGDHAWGCYPLGHDRIAKAPGLPWGDMYSKFVTIASEKGFIGHTRFATQGKPEKNENNHPFVVGDWVVTHNGCVHTWKKEIEKKKQVEVDSELIGIVLQETKGELKDKIQKVFDDINGSIAVSCVNWKNPYEVVLFGSPIFYGFDDDGIWYASERDFLVYIGCSKIDSSYGVGYTVITAEGVKDKVLLKNTTTYHYGGRKYNEHKWDDWYDKRYIGTRYTSGYNKDRIEFEFEDEDEMEEYKLVMPPEHEIPPEPGTVITDEYLEYYYVVIGKPITGVKDDSCAYVFPKDGRMRVALFFEGYGWIEYPYEGYYDYLLKEEKEECK